MKTRYFPKITQFQLKSPSPICLISAVFRTWQDQGNKAGAAQTTLISQETSGLFPLRLSNLICGHRNFNQCIPLNFDGNRRKRTRGDTVLKPKTNHFPPSLRNLPGPSVSRFAEKFSKHNKSSFLSPAACDKHLLIFASISVERKKSRSMRRRVSANFADNFNFVKI